MPALRALRAARPEASLEIAAQPRLGALLVALGLADRARSVDGLGLEELFGGAPAERARILAEMGRVVCWFAGRDVGFARRLAGLVPGAVVSTPGDHGPRLVWEHLVATAGGARDAMVEPVAVGAALREEGRARLVAAGWDGDAPLVIVHPGAGGAAKRWLADGFARTIQALGVVPVVHEGPADAGAVAALRARLGDDVPVLRDPPLPALAGALAGARLYLGNDSGVSHLAAMVGAPSLVLFRPENLPWQPWSAAARVLVVSTTALETHDLIAVVAAARAALG